MTRVAQERDIEALSSCVMLIGEKPEGSDGPWFCEMDPSRVDRFVKWLRSRGCTGAFAAEVYMPEEAFKRLLALQESTSNLLTGAG